MVIADNPLVDTTDYRMSVLVLLPQLERLDKDNVSPDERAEAEERILVKLNTIYVKERKKENTSIHIHHISYLHLCHSRNLKNLLYRLSTKRGRYARLNKMFCLHKVFHV